MANAMEVLPSGEVLLAYTIACAVLFLTPGPDMSLFLARTVAGGRKAGLAAMAGALSGSLVHTVLAAVGLSALLAASWAAFTALKIVGALYLAWLAIDAIRHGSALNLDAERGPQTSVWRTYLLGIGVNLTNPKVILFFVTFLPQFVAPEDPHASAKLLVLGIYFVAFSLPCAVAMILLAEHLIGYLKSRPGVLRVIDWTFAGVFGLFAVKILLMQGK